MRIAYGGFAQAIFIYSSLSLFYYFVLNDPDEGNYYLVQITNDKPKIGIRKQVIFV